MSENVVKKVGIVIRRLRDKAGLTREKLSELTDVHPNTIFNIEHGKTDDSTINRLDKIANALGTTLESILALAESEDLRRDLVLKLEQSPWKITENITQDELEWLKSIPFEKCMGTDPNEKAMSLLVQAKRASTKQ